MCYISRSQAHLQMLFNGAYKVSISMTKKKRSRQKKCLITLFGFLLPVQPPSKSAHTYFSSAESILYFYITGGK